jgi:multicomponent Na+:H+ antiporter subunit F
VSGAVSVALMLAGVALLACIVAGLWRAIAGPSVEDRLTAFVLLGASGAALFIVLATVTGLPALRDVAIVVVGLATIVAVVFTRRTAR